MSMADLIFALAWPPVFAFARAVILRALRTGRPWAVAVAEGWTGAGIGVVLTLAFAGAGHWPGMALGAAQVAVGAWLWRRGRRGRRRAPRAYGAKSRALVAVLVAKARDAARPRPALRPVPGAA